MKYWKESCRFLQNLREKGIGIGLGSASKNAMIILERLQIKDLFQTIIDGTKTTRSKPDPQVFQMGASDLAVQPAECIVFEDAAKGIDAALGRGILGGRSRRRHQPGARAPRHPGVSGPKPGKHC